MNKGEDKTMNENQKKSVESKIEEKRQPDVLSNLPFFKYHPNPVETGAVPFYNNVKKEGIILNV